MTAPDLHIQVSDLRLSYGPKEVIHGISFDVRRHEVLGVIGPAQSGKTSLLRCLNRTIDFTAGARVGGSISVDGQDIRRGTNVYDLRRKIGMAYQDFKLLPERTVADNIAIDLA